MREINILDSTPNVVEGMIFRFVYAQVENDTFLISSYNTNERNIIYDTDLS
jgi:hypothetical protein